MVDPERLLESGFPHVVAIVLGVVGAVALATGAATADAFVFWVIYALAWISFLDLFEEKSALWENLFGDESEKTAEAKPRDEFEDGSPIAVLKRRYAEGHIDDEEFEDRLDRLLETPDSLVELESERAR